MNEDEMIKELAQPIIEKLKEVESEIGGSSTNGRTNGCWWIWNHRWVPWKAGRVRSRWAGNDA